MPDGIETKWFSFENPTGAKSEGGKVNKGAKGQAYLPMEPGETRVLMDYQGSGTIRRMWMTMSHRDPKMLRSQVLRFYWDNAETAAVEVPVSDFFGHMLGEMSTFQSDLFESAEGRSFVCHIPMAFRTAAKVTFTNESNKRMDQLYYDIDATVNEEHPDNMLYFHATWQRDRRTELGIDFEILPKVEGKGRFLGAHIGIIGDPKVPGWWGEGEVKMYLDGDTEWPTICGTGTEDYIGTAYGQGVFSARFQGCWMVDEKNRRFTFYRHHVPDPVYFYKDARVTIQQLGGSGRKEIARIINEGVEVKPVSIMKPGARNQLLLDMDPVPDVTTNDHELGDGFTIVYRRDDVCAVALFYLDNPENGLPRIAPVQERIYATAK